MNGPGGIVWLASFPKSGNTWFRVFLANLAAGDKGPADINNLDERGGISSDRSEFEAETMLDSSIMSHDEIDLLRPRVYAAIATKARQQRWIKAHDALLPNLAGEPLLECPGARVVYVIRDPRDVAVSLSHHNNTTIDAAIAMMNSPKAVYASSAKGLSRQLRQQLRDWSGHVESWVDQTSMPVLTLRYEDLLADPAKGFTEALAFAGREATAEDVERAVRHSAFDELKRQETEKDFAERMAKNARFFREGRSGGWRERLTSEQAAALCAAHGPVMKRFGYEV